jgi:hypothetical protein
MTTMTLEPKGWLNRSTYRFMAPDKKAIVGRIMSAQMPSIRAQLSITSEDVAESVALQAILATRPLAPGVTPVSVTEVAGQVTRVFRFNHPLHGWMIQQSQTFIKAGTRLYTILLTADPLNFAAAEQEARRSPRFVQLSQEST